MYDNSLLYKIALTQISGVGPVSAKNLIAYCGSVEQIFREKKSNLMKIPGIGSVTADSIINSDVLKRAEKEILNIEKYDIVPIFYTDKEYSQRLFQCADSPILIYVKGKVNLNHLRILSIVGTRSVTPVGKENCEQIIHDLAISQYNPLIISGLAYGVDIAAHKSALYYNLPTLAVLAHGLDTIYPPHHSSVAQQMQANGGIITEFMTGTKIDRNYFLQRNRLIAGLADGVLVVESGIKGGALVTAEFANDYNREVMALPGRVRDVYSAGCNMLIKKNKAALVETAEDIAACFSWDVSPKKKHKETIEQPLLFVDLTAEQNKIIEILKAEGKLHVDVISAHTNLPTSKISTNLLELEFANIVRGLPGSVFELK